MKNKFLFFPFSIFHFPFSIFPFHFSAKALLPRKHRPQYLAITLNKTYTSQRFCTDLLFPHQPSNAIITIVI